MSILISKDKSELIATCNCGCYDGLNISIDKNETDRYAIITYLKGQFYTEQDGVLKVFIKKMKRIWAVIRNKDCYYSEILMSKEDFEQFRKYINII